MSSQLIALGESSVDHEHADDFRRMKSITKSAIERLNQPFVIFTDFPSLQSQIENIEVVRSNSNFSGIVLCMEGESAPISMSFIIEELSKPILRKLVTASDKSGMWNRMHHAWKVGAAEDLIADFTVMENGDFYLIDCKFNKYNGNMFELDLFKKASIEQLRNYTIDEHGSDIYFAAFDYHLDLDYFKSELDEEFKKKQIAKSLALSEDFGKRMRAFRESKEVAQTDFNEISDKQIRRYETGAMYPTFKSLAIIADRFGMNVTDYLAAVRDLKLDKD